MRLYTVILTFFICHGINNSVCQIDERLPDDDSSRKELKTGLVSFLDTLSIYRTAFSLSYSETALEACCQDFTTPGLDLLFVSWRYFHGLLKWVTVSIIDKFFEGYGSSSAKSVQSQPAHGEFPTHHGISSSPPLHPSLEKPVFEKMIKEFPKFANLEATPRRVICKCGKQRGCEQKPPKPNDDSKPIIKALVKTLPKELPDPLLWVIFGIFAGFIVTVICQITQRAGANTKKIAVVFDWAVNNAIQKETAKDTARYIFLALKELDLYTTSSTSRQRPRQRSLQQRARKALASRHLRPRPSHTMMDCNNLLETRNPEDTCIQPNIDESTVHPESKIKDTPDLSLGNSEKDNKTEAEETISQRNAENSSRHRQSSPSFCDPRVRKADAAAKEIPGIEERLDSSPHLWCLPSSQMPVVDPVWPSGSPWIDSDDYSNAHSIHKLALPSESKASLCSSLGDEMRGPWVSTSLSFIVYDLDIIEDIPDEVLEVLSCDDQPCTVHPHERYHYLGRKVIVQRLPLPDKTTTFIPSIELKVSSLPSVPIQEPVAVLDIEHQAANLDNLTSKKLMSDRSPSHVHSIDQIVLNDEVQNSDQDLDEADNLLVSSEEAFTSLEEFENGLSTQKGNLEDSGSSLLTLFGNDTVSSRLQEGSKTAKEILAKFENIGSMVTALNEVINFCHGITEQQKTEESFAQKEVLLDDLGSHDVQRIHRKPLISIPLKSLDRSFSLEKVSAVKAGLDELGPGIKAFKTVEPNKKSYSPKETSVVIEPTSNVFLGRSRPKICLPAAKAASADFTGDQKKPAITSSARTSSLATDELSRSVRSESKPPDRNALFKDLKEKVAAKGLGRSENEADVPLRNAGTDVPEWEDSDLSLIGERGENILKNESGLTSRLFDFKSSLEKATNWKLPRPPSSPRLPSLRHKKDTSGQSPLRKKETKSDGNDEEDHNIVIVPFGFPVKASTPEPPTLQSSSSLKTTKDSEERLQRSHESFRSDSYRTLSKVSLTESSSTWEVSDRGRKSVFSPVGWSTKRSEVSSLFREQNGEKIHESSSQSQAMTLSPKKHTNAESPKIADTRKDFSPIIKSVVENSKMDEYRTMCHTNFDPNPRKRRTGKQNADSFTSNKGKSTNVSIGLAHSLTSHKEKHQSKGINIPVICEGTTTGDRNARAPAAGALRNDPTDSLHQPYIIKTETPDHCEKNFRANWKLSSSMDQPKSKTLITGKPPLPRDNRTSSLYGSRHAPQNYGLTEVTSNRSTPVSPNTMSEEESDRDINEELKRHIRGMVKTGKIVQGLIRKKSTEDSNNISSQQKKESNPPLPKPRANIAVYLQGKKRNVPPSSSAPQDKVNGPPNVDNSISATSTGCDKSHDTTTVYQDIYPMGNQDKSDSSQASSGYASVFDREGPVIDILMPVSAGSLCSAGMEKFLKPETIAVSPADGSDAGDSLSQTNVARPKLSKIPIFSNLHEDNRVQRKAKRKFYDAQEDNKNRDYIEKESSSVGFGPSFIKSRSEQKPGNSGYTCSVKTGLLGQARPNAHSMGSGSTRWVDSKLQESNDAQKKLPVVGDKKALLTSPRKIPRTSRMKRVSPLIAQKIGLLERTLTDNGTKVSEECKGIAKLYECLGSGNSTTNAWAGDVTCISDKEVIDLRRLDKPRRSGEKIRPAATKRVSCLPRLIRHTVPLPKEENFSQNHIASIFSNFTMHSPQDQLACASFDSFSGKSVDSCTDSPQDSIARSVESTLTKGSPKSYVEYLPECEESSHIIVNVINRIASPKERLSSPITNYETAELKKKTQVLASTLEEHQQRLIQREGKIISRETEENGSCKRRISRSKSDSNLGRSFPVSSLAQINKHSEYFLKERDSFKSGETKGCDWPTMSTSLPLEGNAFDDLTVDEHFPSQLCFLPDDADSPEMVTIVGFPQANSTVDEDDEDTVTSHVSSCIVNTDLENVKTSMTTPSEGCHLNISRRHAARLTGSFDMRDQDGQAKEAHQTVMCGQRSRPLCGACWDADSPLSHFMGVDSEEFMWNVDLPIAGSRDVMAVLPKMLVDLVLRSRDLSHDNEQLTTTALEEGFDDLPPHDVIHESRDLRIYGHSSFLEIGMAWLLQKTFSKISAKGDNFGIMNNSTFDTRIQAIGKNASF